MGLREHALRTKGRGGDASSALSRTDTGKWHKQTPEYLVSVKRILESHIPGGGLRWKSAVGVDFRLPSIIAPWTPRPE